MAETEQPQIYLITPPAFELSSFPPLLARVLDADGRGLRPSGAVDHATRTRLAAPPTRCARSPMPATSRW